MRARDQGIAPLVDGMKNPAETLSRCVSPWKRHLDRAVPIKVKCLTMNNCV